MSIFYCDGCQTLRDADFKGYHVIDDWITTTEIIDGKDTDVSVYSPLEYCDDCWDNLEEKADESN